MFNAASRISLLSFVAAVALSVASCGDKAEVERASALVSQAREALDAGSFDRVILLTDSVKNSCPRAIGQRREALHLAVRAKEGMTVRQLERTDSLMAVLGVKADSLKQLVKFVENPVEGYYVAVGTNTADVYNRTGLQARMSPEGDFYIISTLKGLSHNTVCVRVSGPAGMATTPAVGHDGERNDRSAGAEVITFIAAECDSLGRMVALHPDDKMTLTFISVSGKCHDVPLSKADASHIATVYNYANVLRQGRLAAIERERLGRALDISRSQAARTYVEPDSASAKKN